MSATSYWVGLVTTPDHSLEKMDVAKTAAKHGIPLEWAVFWRKTWLERAR